VTILAILLSRDFNLTSNFLAPSPILSSKFVSGVVNKSANAST